MDRRNDYRPHYGGGGNNRRGGGGYRRRNNNNNNQRRRDQPPPLRPEQVLASLLFQLGDGQQDVQASMQKLVAAVEEDMVQQRDNLVELLIPIALKQPVKIALYATLVGLLESNTPGFGEAVIDRLLELQQSAINNWDPYQTRLMLRFIFELVHVGVVQGQSFVQFLKLFVDEVQNADASTVAGAARQEYCLAVIIYLVPFIGGYLHEHYTEDLHTVLDATQAAVLQRKVPNSLASKQRQVLAIFHNGSQQGTVGPDWLLDRWERLAATYTPNGEGSWRAVDAAAWKELDDVIQRADPAFVRAHVVNCTAKSFAVPTIPAHVEGQAYEGLHRSVFRLFDRSDVENGLKPGVRVLMEQYIVDLATAMFDCHKEAVKYMLNLPFPNVRPHFFVVETIFGMLFELPAAKHRHLFYHVLIGDAVKMDPQKIAPVLGQAIDLLYNRLDQLSADCFDRFVEWFGIHLSNFDWKWNWGDWATVQQERDDSHRRRFVCEVLQQCVNLSYLDRIARTVPETFKPLLPPKPTVNYEYVHSDFAGEMLRRIRERETADQILAIVKSTSEFPTEEEKLKAVLQIFLNIGAKSCTHILKLVEKFLPVLKYLIHSPEKEVQALDVLLAFWINSKQHVVILLDKLMTYQVVSNISITKWLFSERTAQCWKDGFLWTILRNTLNKTIAKVEAVEGQLVAANRIPDEDEPVNMDDGPSVNILETKLAEAKEEKLLLFQEVLQQFSAILSSGNITDEFVQYRVTGHLEEVVRKYAGEVKAVVEAKNLQDTVGGRVQQVIEEAALLQ